MPEPSHTIMPEGTTQKIWLMAPSEDRANLRSETPPGFARAVFQANKSAVDSDDGSNGTQSADRK